MKKLKKAELDFVNIVTNLSNMTCISKNTVNIATIFGILIKQ